MNNNSFVCLECVNNAHEGLRLLAENGCEDFPWYDNNNIDDAAYAAEAILVVNDDIMSAGLDL